MVEWQFIGVIDFGSYRSYGSDLGADTRYAASVTTKRERIEQLLGDPNAGSLNPYYYGYFDHFNRGLFYESHDVLEQLWLKDRHGPNGDFYKGLIQLAGAFVHLQKERLRPAAALFKLAAANLRKYPSHHEHLEIVAVLKLIEHWLGRLENSQFTANPLATDQPPQLQLNA
jgi:hypothetical protein